MKKYLFFFTLGLYSLVYSQTTITKAFNDPVAGDVVTGNVVTGTVNNSGTGTGVTFNNSALTAGSAALSTYSVPSAAEISSYPGSTIKNSDGSGNTIFYKTSASQLEITALITSAGTLNFSADNAVAILYPTSYGTPSNTDQARGTFTSTTASGLIKGTVTTTADATGTLLLGPNVFPNILRIKSVQNFNLYQSTDTFYLFPVGSIISTAYQYYDNIRKYPLLSYTDITVSVPLLSINQTTTAATAQSFAFLSSNDLDFKSEVNIAPNPVNDLLMIEGISKEKIHYEIFSSEGKLIKKGLSTKTLDVSELVSGKYVLIIEQDHKKISLPFLKK